MKRLVLLAALLLSTGARAADIDSALVDAARKEGQVVWYSTMIVNQIVRPMVEAFQKKYPGIEVQYFRAGGTDVALKITNEARTRRIMADILDSSSALGPLQDAGLIAEYRPKQGERLPANRKDPNGKWTALSVYYYTAAYNTNIVSAAEAPQSYEDLLDPKWKGKIAWTNDISGGGPPGFVENILRSMGREKGREYLKKFAAQEPVTIPAAQRVVLDKVISGEYPIALQTLSYHSTISAAIGAPVQWLKMPPMIMSPNPVAILSGGPHPNAARLLVEFMLSPEGQQILAANDYMPSDPEVPIKVKELQPEHGHFAITVFSPDDIRANLRTWYQTYQEIFK